MKKILGFLTSIIIVLILIAFFLGGGNGFGGGDRASSQNMAQVEEIDEPESETDEDIQKSNIESEKTIYKVSVAESDYFYENERISLDQLMKTFSEIEGDYIVEIKDERASKKAYELLVNALSENGIEYVEK